MAENFYTTHTVTPNPMQGFEAGAKAAQSGADVALQSLLQGKNEEKMQGLKAALAQKALSDLIAKQKSGDIKGGASLNGASLTTDPYAKQAQAQEHGNASAMKNAQSIYNRSAQNVEKTIGPIKEMLDSINDPNNPGAAGLAKTLAIRIQGMNRYNGEEGNAIVPTQLMNKIEGTINSFTGQGNNPLTSTQKAALNQMALSALNSAQEYHGRIKQNALNAYSLDPYHTAEGVNQLQSSLGAPLDQAMQGLNKKYAGMVPQTQGPALQDQSQASPGLADKLKAFFRPGPQTAPVAPQATPQLQMPSFDDFKKWKAAQAQAQQQAQPQEQEPGMYDGGEVRVDSSGYDPDKADTIAKQAQAEREAAGAAKRKAALAQHENDLQDASQYAKPSPIPDSGDSDRSFTPHQQQGIQSIQKSFMKGGKVPGNANVDGDSPLNDIVKAKLSPGEVVIPRHIMESADPVAAAHEFVANIVKKRPERRG